MNEYMKTKKKKKHSKFIGFPFPVGFKPHEKLNFKC